MKKIMLAAAFVLLSCGTAFAQFTNASGSTKSTGSSTPVEIKDWTSVYVQYNPSRFIPKNGDSESFNRFTFGVSRAINVMQSQPLYIEVGGNLQFGFTSEFVGSELKWKMLSIGVPVNLTYAWHITNKFAIAPYFGFNMRVNVWGNLTHDDYDKSLDIFDDDDVSDALQHKRFQIGWQIGANFQFNDDIYIGAGYGTDFMEIFEKCKIGRAHITLGLMF